MADVNVGFSGDGSPVKRAWEVSAEGVTAFINEVKKINAASNAAESAQRELGTTANRWLKQMETPLDSHLRRMGELQTILQAGKITQHEYSKGIALSVAEMREAEDAADTLGQTAKRVLQEQQGPQDVYNAKIATYTQLRQANKITEEQFGIAVSRAKQQLDSQDVSLQALLRDGLRIRASLVSPQEEYEDRVKRATQALNAEIISEAQYAHEVEAAKDALDSKDVALQKVRAAAEKIRAASVTPEQAHAAAIEVAKQALERKLITQQQYDRELNNQNRILREAKSAQTEFLTAGQQAQKNLGNQIDMMAVKVLGISTAYQTVMQSISAVRQEHSKFNEAVQRTIEMSANEELKLQIKGGLLPSQVEQKMPQIQAALMETPVVDMAGGLMIQSQIESSGFSREDIDNNSALKASLEIKAATNGFKQAPQDISKATQAIAMFQKAMGNLVPTAADIRGTGVNMTALFKESEIEFEDLTQLAEHTATLSNFGLKENDILGAFSTLRDQMGVEKGASGLRNMVARLATAKGDKEKEKALKSIGLKPEDVDMAKGGDEFIPTMEKIMTALEGKTEEQRNVFMNRMLGEQGAAAGNTILNRKNLDQIKGRIALQNDPTEFEKNVDLFRGSREARNTRNQLTLDFANRQIDKQNGGTTRKEAQLAADAMRAQMQAEGSISGTRRALGGAFANWVWNPVAEGLGLAPPTVESLQSRRIRGDADSPLEQAVAANDLGKGAVAKRENEERLKQPLDMGGIPLVAPDLVDELRGLRQDIRENSKDTRDNTKKKATKPVHQPTKTPASAGLQTK